MCVCVPWAVVPVVSKFGSSDDSIVLEPDIAQEVNSGIEQARALIAW